MDVFKANFYELSEKAYKDVFVRAGAFADAFLTKAMEDGQEKIPEAENPDFQYALFSAQREYARVGDEDLGELLVQLLVDRSKIEDRTLIQIVLNQSLAVAPMLTPEQLDALTLIFLINHTINNSLSTLARFHWYLDNYILPFVPGVSAKYSAYQHLEFARCGAITIGETQIEEAFRMRYMGLLCKGFTEEEAQTVDLTPEARSQLIVPCLHNNALYQVNALNDGVIDSKCAELGVEPEKVERLKSLQIHKVLPLHEIKEYVISTRPQTARLFEVWDSTLMNSMTLTSVGIAIADANLKRRTGISFDLSTWI